MFAARCCLMYFSWRWWRNRDIWTETETEKFEWTTQKKATKFEGKQIHINVPKPFRYIWVCVCKHTPKTRNGEWLITVQITSNHGFISIYLFILCKFIVGIYSSSSFPNDFHLHTDAVASIHTHTRLRFISWYCCGLIHSYSFLIFSFCVAQIAIVLYCAFEINIRINIDWFFIWVRNLMDSTDKSQMDDDGDDDDDDVATKLGAEISILLFSWKKARLIVFLILAMDIFV